MSGISPRLRGWTRSVSTAFEPTAYGTAAHDSGAHDPGATDTGRRSLRVGLVQGAIGNRELWRLSLQSKHFSRYLELSRSPELAGADLIVWPENAVPYLLDRSPASVERLQDLARETGAAILLGAPRSGPIQTGPAAIYNSAYFFPAGGGEYQTYSKRRLLPYIERMPVWFRFLSRKRSATEYSPGDTVHAFDVRGWKVAPMICFESIYPKVGLMAAREGADLFVNLVNDIWFDHAGGSEQHFRLAALRSPEQGIPMVRAANGGISALVDGAGRILETLPRRVEAVRLVTVPEGSGATPYRSLGDAFGVLSLAIGVLLSAVGFRRRDGENASQQYSPNDSPE